MTMKSIARVVWNRRVLAVAGVLAVLATSACSQSGNSSSSTSGAAAGGNGKAKIFVIGGKSDDPFWSKVKRGVDDAAKVVQAQGGSVTFLGPQNYDNLGPDAAKLIDSTLSQGATAVIAPDWVPDAEDAALKHVTDQKVPLFIYNAGGLPAADKVGAVNYVGSEEYTAGKAGGTYLGQHSAKHSLCVNTLPGSTNTEDRCRGIGDGIKANGGTSTELPLPSSQFGNQTAVAQAIKAALLKDSSIDSVVTISTSDAGSAVSAVQQANLTGKVKPATFDMDTATLNNIKNGTTLFAIDQQPYMQGYLSVSMANSYVAYGINLPQRPILTGPAIIDSQNVDQALAGEQAGVR
ncbi:sugar ABC transporter substrate-binding protein [Sinomonas sp. JGH33]|uniref:Sugar ABC transporter substrate-binding protein n=1 Tax=Sinomonas terricola TaxID=3110330 RepID=A0ABU5TAR4_9MICC|nr:sugar ABC transporter substrate-binding protein [Sinomonas sp. JGH33]MEA5456757.1 sugar ABC transporter substrate-binding protein [Sinomonas sp. JGH33]